MKIKILFLIIFLITLLLFIIIFNLLFFDFIFSNNTIEKNNIIIKSNFGEKIYIAPYIGDIDGDVSQDWFFFFKKLSDFHNDNKIPVTFSFYPISIRDNKDFNSILANMYDSNYIELQQKGFRGDKIELKMDELSYTQQKQIIEEGQKYYVKKMKEILKKDFIILPTSYNQIGGKFNEKTKKATEELGFNIYFDMFVGDNVVPLNSSKNYDIVQYGSGFSKTGYAGKEAVFFSPFEMFSNALNYNRSDVNIIHINGIKVVPIWAHQQDFEKGNNKLDNEKWEIYTSTLIALKEDPNVYLLTSKEIYDLRRGKINL